MTIIDFPFFVGLCADDQFNATNQTWFEWIYVFRKKGINENVSIWTLCNVSV